MDPIEIYNAVCVNDYKLKPWRTFIYIDGPEYLADKLFEKNGIRPYLVRELSGDETAYIAISCIIRKSKTGEFLSAMHELQKNMVICGYNDYEEFCRDLFSTLTEDGDDDD